MQVVPFERVGVIVFSTTQEQLLRTLGPPLQEHHNRACLHEYEYPTEIYRYDQTGQLEEVSFYAVDVFLGNQSVGFQELGAYVRSHDVLTFEGHGFLVSPRFGVAFDPESPCWTTAISRGVVEKWRVLCA